MDVVDMAEMIAGLSDDALIATAKMANEDCLEAAETQRDSEWHGACFAACYVLCRELTKRGLRLKPLQ